MTVPRYVTHEYSRPWLIYSYKNVKGRGVQKVDADEVSLSNLKICVEALLQPISMKTNSFTVLIQPISTQWMLMPLGMLCHLVGELGTLSGIPCYRVL